LSFELIEAVAEYLGIPPIAAHEAATFYSMLELKPVGRHKLCVCTNISCMLLGSDDIAAHLGKKLGIGFGETTADGKFTLKEVECLGACGGAPMMMIGRTYYENLTPARVDEILADLE
jgi:NADH-quinone oxidoreductase subunit E